MKISRRGPPKGGTAALQPACEQSFGAGHAYTTTLDNTIDTLLSTRPQEGISLRPSLIVGDALLFSSLSIDNVPGSVSSLCSGTGLLKNSLIASGVV